MGNPVPAFRALTSRLGMKIPGKLLMIIFVFQGAKGSNQRMWRQLTSLAKDFGRGEQNGNHGLAMQRSSLPPLVKSLRNPAVQKRYYPGVYGLWREYLNYRTDMQSTSGHQGRDRMVGFRGMRG